MNVRTAPRRMALHLAHLPLTSKLAAIHLLLVGSLVAVIGVAWQMLPGGDTAAAETAMLNRAQRATQNADMLHDALRSDVLITLLTGEVTAQPVDATQRSLHLNAQEFRTELLALQDLPLRPALKAHVVHTRSTGMDYVAQAEKTGELSLRDRAAALAQMADFETRFQAAKHALAEQTRLLGEAVRDSHARADAAAAQARLWLLLAGTGAFVLSSVCVTLIARSIRRSLVDLRTVAQAIAWGQLDERASVTGRDEVGQLAESVNRMADNLAEMIGRMQRDAERDAFSRELVEALEMADGEPDVHEVVALTMRSISSHTPMELLLADSSDAHLERAAQHPDLGAPGCTVTAPFGCTAVRRANPVVFNDGDAINACRHLRARPCGTVAAVCVPVTFMGRSLGVLHAATRIDVPLSATQAERLATLGTQAGARIGTVRAFERTQIQASTDSLTGLPNRRALEHALRELSASRKPFAFVLGDLDHFKRLNDKHGHQAGDDALRLFSDVVRAGMRNGDLAARWGGEEFAFLLVDSSVEEAKGWAQRLRVALAEALGRRGSPGFTASFGLADSTMARRLDQLTRLADEALYAAKGQGRDRAVVADAQLLRSQPQRAESEHDAQVDMTLLAG